MAELGKPIFYCCCNLTVEYEQWYLQLDVRMSQVHFKVLLTHRHYTAAAARTHRFSSLLLYFLPKHTACW